MTESTELPWTGKNGGVNLSQRKKLSKNKAWIVFPNCQVGLRATRLASDKNLKILSQIKSKINSPIYYLIHLKLPPRQGMGHFWHDFFFPSLYFNFSVGPRHDKIITTILPVKNLNKKIWKQIGID